MRFSLAGKLSAAFAFVALLASAAGLYLALMLGTVQTDYSAVLALSAANTEASDVKFAIQGQQSAMRGVILYKNQSLVQQFETYTAMADERIRSLQARLTGISTLTETDRANLAEAQALNAKYAEIAHEIAALTAVGQYEEATAYFLQVGPPVASRLVAVADEIAKAVDRETVSQTTEINNGIDQTQVIAYVVVVAGLLAGVGIGLFLARSISRPVQQVALSAQRLGSGDLTVEALTIRSQDEVGQMAHAFNVMAENLRQLMRGLAVNAESVMASSEQLSASAEQAANAAGGAAQAVNQVARGTGEQSRSAEDVRQTMEQLRQTIQQVANGASSSAGEVSKASELLGQMVRSLETVANNAAGVADGANEAARTAQSGAEVVDRTLDGMERIREAVGLSSERIKELERLSAQIGDITVAISEIAGQTNLLALNAAIEAARAGEHGRGFAVVAEEVRKLAERASSSTKQIADLIGSIQAQTTEAVKAMEVGTSEVENGSRMAAEAGRSLAEILQSVQKAAREVTAISEAAGQVQGDAQRVVQAFDSMAAVTEQSTAAAEQMAASSAEVTDSVTRIARLSQENAGAAQEVSASVEELTASSEEVSASAAGLSRIAQNLQEQVVRFKV